MMKKHLNTTQILKQIEKWLPAQLNCIGIVCFKRYREANQLEYLFSIGTFQDRLTVYGSFKLEGTGD